MKRQWKPKNFSSFSRQLNELLAPERVQHEDAKIGSTILRELPAADKAAMFHALFFKKQGTDALATSLLPQDAPDAERQKACLVAALRRLSIVGTGLASKVRQEMENDSEKEKRLPEESEPAYRMSFNPGTTLAEHIKAADLAPKDYDCVGKMASLSSLLELQLKSLYTHTSRTQNPFMMVKDVNMVSQTYMNALEKLHKMQVDVGIVEKQPEKMEVNVNQAGAFQSYIGELSRDQKKAMAEFADTFCKIVKEKAENARLQPVS